MLMLLIIFFLISSVVITQAAELPMKNVPYMTKTGITSNTSAVSTIITAVDDCVLHSSNELGTELFCSGTPIRTFDNQTKSS